VKEHLFIEPFHHLDSWLDQHQRGSHWKTEFDLETHLGPSGHGHQGEEDGQGKNLLVHGWTS
jgi:hypothetical protein